jgi:hypothetical protein
MGRPKQIFSYNSPPIPSPLSSHVRKSSLSSPPVIFPLKEQEKSRKIFITLQSAFGWKYDVTDFPL